MYCDNCGNEIDKDSEFCEYCGKKVKKDVSAEVSVIKENTNRKKKYRKGIIAVAIVAAMALVAFIGVWLHNSPARRLAEHLDLGNHYLEEMDYEQAVVAFTKAIEIDPMSTDAYIGAAKAYVGLDNMDEAITVLEKGYELTGNEEILEVLEELRGSREEIRETEEVVESVTEKNNEDSLPYFELGFSPEDFTIAGYSIMDGSHIDDIEQAAAAIMPQNTDTSLTTDYMGWCYGDMPLIDGIELSYYYPGDIAGEVYKSSTGDVGYEADGTHFYVGYFNEEPEQGVTLDEFPLYEGKVTPNVTSYEETLDILGIRQLVQAIEENEYVLRFKSQYGCGVCEIDEEEGYQSCYISFAENENGWTINMEFRDSMLWMIALDRAGVAGIAE